MAETLYFCSIECLREFERDPPPFYHGRYGRRRADRLIRGPLKLGVESLANDGPNSRQCCGSWDWQGLLGAFDTLYFHELRAKASRFGQNSQSRTPFCIRPRLGYLCDFLSLRYPGSCGKAGGRQFSSRFLGWKLSSPCMTSSSRTWCVSLSEGSFPAERGDAWGCWAFSMECFWRHCFPCCLNGGHRPAGFAFQTLSTPLWAEKLLCLLWGALSFLSGTFGTYLRAFCFPPQRMALVELCQAGPALVN